MKIRRQIFLSILTFTLLGHAVAAQEITVAAAADLQSAMQDSPSARYTITELGTLGGNYSFSYGLNNAGVVAGGAATATQTDFVSQTGFLWYRGQIINVGTLGGAACPECSSEAGGPNAVGISPALSETANKDPNKEDFCGFGTTRTCGARLATSRI